MPSGEIHARDSRLAAVAAGVGIVLMTRDPLASLLVAGGSLAGIPLSPDLDHHNRTYAERYFVVGVLWSWFWKPYERLIPHRSPLSHFPVLGTVLRQLYLIVPIWLLFYAVGWESQNLFENLLWLVVQPWYQWLLLGLMLSDAIHWVQDVRPKAFWERGGGYRRRVRWRWFRPRPPRRRGDRDGWLP